MTWLRIDDQTMSDPRFMRADREAPSAALHLWLALSLYCSQHLTDGAVPLDMLPDIRGPRGKRTLQRALDALVNNGLVELRQRVAEGSADDRQSAGELLLVDYLNNNPLSGDVRRAREQAAQKKRKQRLAQNVPGGRPRESSRARPRTPVPSRTNDGSPSGDPPACPPAQGPHLVPVAPANDASASDAPASDAPPLGTVDARAPMQAQPERLVHHSLDGWEPTEADVAAAVMAGLRREVYLERVAELRNGPIGGARGVYDRSDYVQRQVPKWVRWEAERRAKALKPRGGGGTRGFRPKPQNGGWKWSPEEAAEYVEEPTDEARSETASSAISWNDIHASGGAS